MNFGDQFANVGNERRFAKRDEAKHFFQMIGTNCSGNMGDLRVPNVLAPNQVRSVRIL